ncbi:MAG: hypothetical protein HY553_18805 [Elusimicrobia bacterium]|nr:hypothetical protein [Elusimicrobiota bacterium]
MTHPELALERILSCASPLEIEEAPLEDCAGRALGAPVSASVDLPPFDHAAGHGYAVFAGDVEGASPEFPAPLRLAAGLVRSGDAVPVEPGAPVPKGTQAVVAAAETEVDDGGVRVFTPARVGARIRARGSDVRCGELLFEKGAVLRAHDVAVLAAQGRSRVPVVRRARVAVAACSGEGADAASPAVLAAVESWGALGQPRGVVPDGERAAREALAAALAACDALIVVSRLAESCKEGASAALLALGLQPEFWGVAAEPGSSFFFGRCRGKLVFGLPGPASAALVFLEEFVRPAIERLQGRAGAPPAYPLTGAIDRDLLKAGARQLYAYAAGEAGASGWRLRLIPAHRLGISREANALVRVPIGPARLPAGAPVGFRWLA